jgi:hypothetical protein
MVGGRIQKHKLRHISEKSQQRYLSQAFLPGIYLLLRLALYYTGPTPTEDTGDAAQDLIGLGNSLQIGLTEEVAQATIALREHLLQLEPEPISFQADLYDLTFKLIDSIRCMVPDERFILPDPITAALAIRSDHLNINASTLTSLLNGVHWCLRVSAISEIYLRSYQHNGDKYLPIQVNAQMIASPTP